MPRITHEIGHPQEAALLGEQRIGVALATRATARCAQRGTIVFRLLRGIATRRRDAIDCAAWTEAARTAGVYSGDRENEGTDQAESLKRKGNSFAMRRPPESLPFLIRPPALQTAQ